MTPLVADRLSCNKGPARREPLIGTLFRRIDMAELDGKVAVITGAGSGMARASARVFVREGARVLAADISGREEETAAELGEAVLPCRCDLTHQDPVDAMFSAARPASAL